MAKRRTFTEDDFGIQRDVSMKDLGKEWPRKHTDTPAMCDVDENGVENEPQGSHKSEPADADYTSSGITKKIGKEWPRPHKDKTTMGQTGEDGTISEPQGVTETEPSEADLTSSGITKKTGHDWPTQAKNTGGNMEPFGNKHRTDKGLKGGDISSAFQAAPKDGVPNVNSEWSPGAMGQIMSEGGYDDEQLQQLFDAYARENDQICLEDFEDLLDAHGVDNLIDEAGFMNLLARNAEFNFFEQEDADGRYWLAEGVPAFLKDKGKKDGKKDGKKPPFGKDDDDEGEDEDDDKPAFLKNKKVDECNTVCKKSKPWKKKSVKEWIELAHKVYLTEQKGRISKAIAARALHVSLNCSLDRQSIRESAPEDRAQINKIAKYYGLKFEEARIAEGPFDMGGPAGPAGPSAAGPMGYDPNDPNAAGLADDQEMLGGSPGTTPGVEPGLGGEHMAGPAGLGDPAMGGDLGGPLGGDLGADPGMAGDLGGPQGLDTGGPMGDNIGMGAATGVDDWAQPGGGPSPGGGTPAMGMGDEVGINDLPGMDTAGMDMNPQMQGLGGRGGMGPGPRGRFEGRRSRRAISEDYPKGNGLTGGEWTGEIKGAGHEMDHVDDSTLGSGQSVAKDGKAKKSPDLPQDDTETTEIKPKDLLGASQKNTVDPTTTAFKDGGCGKLSSESGVAENLNRLARFVKRYLAEHDHGLRGSFALSFNTKVNGKRASSKTDLPGIIADAEELMLMHGAGLVVLEAVYSDPRTNKMLKRVDIQLPAVRARAPMVHEGKVLFRFSRNAERFAECVMAEGLACRLTSHNWGAALHSKLPAKKLNKIFAAIIK